MHSDMLLVRTHDCVSYSEINGHLHIDLTASSNKVHETVLWSSPVRNSGLSHDKCLYKLPWL